MKLRELRLAKGLTQKELAEKIGMSDVAVCYYETGAREPNLETLRKLAAVLECTIDELIGTGEEEEDANDREGHG